MSAPKRSGSATPRKLGEPTGVGNRGKGRKRGVPNKTTAAAKEAFVLAAQGIGGVKALTEWGRANQDKFWPLYAKLIPLDVTSAGEKLSGVVVLPATRDHATTD